MTDLAALLENSDPIVEGANYEYEILLGDLQCNILTGHGKRKAHYFFIRFGDDHDARVTAKYLIGMLPRNAWEREMVFQAMRNAELRDVMPPKVRQLIDHAWHVAGDPLFLDRDSYELISDLRLTSELERRASRRPAAAPTERHSLGGQAVEVRSDLQSRGFALTFLLTSSGYAKLGVRPPPGAAFAEGMVARSQRLNDPDPARREYMYIDALLVVAYDPGDTEEEKATQLKRVDVLRELIRKQAPWVHEEIGVSLVARKASANPKIPQSIEPFGFRDGISQPLFYQTDIDRRGSRGPEWDDFAPLQLVLCRDPNGRTRYPCGTYFVYRKLRQDIERFYGQVDGLVGKTGKPPAEVLAGLVGRNPDGTPLVTASGPNAFDYKDDPSGAACPFHAHVRKSNPRGDVAAIYNARRHRIVRRGMPFGPDIERDDDGRPVLNDDGKVKYRAEPREGTKGDIGLLFMCAQSSIEDQFEHIQTAWMNNPNSPARQSPGADTIAGQVPRDEVNRIAPTYQTPEGNSYTKGRDTDYRQCIELLAGEYFFAPSISFLKGLLDDLWT